MKKTLSLLSAGALALGGLACGTGYLPGSAPGSAGSSGAGANAGSGTGTSSSGLAVFHTKSALKVGSSSSESTRIKIEDYYPAACFDRDEDHDGVPDSVDACPPPSDDSNVLGCKRCNRGPGTQGDLRLRIRGNEGELQRGRVLARNGSELTVPTPDGALTIRITGDTRIDDGEPNPGAEIRAEGTVEGTGSARVLIAERLKVLCPAPAAIPEEEVPADATPVLDESTGGAATGCEDGSADGGSEPGDDNGGGGNEPGDDNGGGGNEPGDDNGDGGNEPGDDNGGGNEPGDDNGVDGADAGSGSGGIN